MSSDSESDSVDTSLVDSLGNTALIEGPPGSGKTSTVFALAAQMGFNVLEVNASSNRTGKQVCWKIILSSGLFIPSMILDFVHVI